MKTKTSRYHFLMILVVFMTATAAQVSNTGSLMQNTENTPAQAAPTIGSCPLFPSNNYWNTPVNTLPIHSLSAAWVNSIGATRHFHMDFGSGTWDGGPIGIPFNVVSGSSTTKSYVNFYYPNESDIGPYPLLASPKIEYGSDHHILTVDTDDCKLYEIYDAEK